MRIIRKWGIHYIEASADVEADPLYCGADYIRHWTHEVGTTARRYGITISSLYTGHGTYYTLGLAHNNEAVRRRIQEEWLKPMINSAADLGANFGFFCHAIPQTILHDPLKYRKTCKDLMECLAYLAVYAKEQKLRKLAIEQMYTPNQPPWTINGAWEMIRKVFTALNAPLYITIDTGHANAQRRYLEPKVRHIAAVLRSYREEKKLGTVWLGPKAAYDIIEEAAETREAIPDLVRELRPKIREQVARHPWLFAKEEDGDIYRWLEELGPFSPIIHLQQNDGRSSQHLPFTPENNMVGIIEPRRLLNSLAKKYLRPPERDLPPICEDVFLTLEIFPTTAQRPREILDMMQRSVEYWRKFIPEDGVPLDQLVEPKEEPIEEIRHPGWMLP